MVLHGGWCTLVECGARWCAAVVVPLQCIDPWRRRTVPPPCSRQAGHSTCCQPASTDQRAKLKSGFKAKAGKGMFKGWRLGCANFPKKFEKNGEIEKLKKRGRHVV